MKYSTFELFGKNKSEYEPEISILAKKRIDDANENMKKLILLRNLPMTSVERQALEEQYNISAEARDWWQKVLDEE